MKKGKLSSKIFGIALVLVMVGAMPGGLGGVANPILAEGSNSMSEDPFNYQGEYIIDATKLTPEEKTALPHVQKYAKEQKVSPALLMAIIEQESNFDPSAIGDAGLAIGYMQLHWDAAYDAGYRSARGTSTDYAREDWPTDGLDPDANIKYGCGYLRIVYAQWGSSSIYGDSLKNAISAYNLGRTHGPDKSNENSYVNPVLGYYEDYKSKYIFAVTIAAVSTYNTILDDLNELVSEGKIVGYDLYTDSNIGDLWVNLDQYRILLVDEDCMFEWTNPGPDYNKPIPVTVVGSSFYNHKTELKNWIYGGGGLFSADQNDVSFSYADADNMWWTWLPDELQVESNQYPSDYPDIGYGHYPYNLEIITDPWIFSTPNEIDITKVAKVECHGRFTEYPGYTALVRDKSDGDILEVFRYYGDGVVVLSHLEYETAHPWDVDYVENEINFLSPETKNIELKLYVEDAIAGRREGSPPVANKAPGDTVDIVAQISNKEDTPIGEVDVTINGPYDQSQLITSFTRYGFTDVDEREASSVSLGNRHTVPISLGKKGTEEASKQIVWRFRIPEDELTIISHIILGEVRVEEVLCDSSATTFSMSDNAKAIIVTNRYLLFKKYGFKERAITWAEDWADGEPYPEGGPNSWQQDPPYCERCLSFVLDAYKYGAGVDPRENMSPTDYECAKGAADALGAERNTGTPPCGAYVFYDWVGTVDGVQRNWGHAALSLGDTDSGGKTEIVHAYHQCGSDVSIIISDDYTSIGLNYIGWAWPPIPPEEVQELLNYLYQIADFGEENCIIYYVDHEDKSLKEWYQEVDYTNETTANRVANIIDNYIEQWEKNTNPPYLMIVGGDEIIPFYRVQDPEFDMPLIEDVEEDTPYNSDDPVKEAIDHNYVLTDLVYADTDDKNWMKGDVELIVGRILGSSAKDMEALIRKATSGPSESANAVVASRARHWNMDTVVNRLRDSGGLEILNDTEQPTTIESSGWGEQDIIDAMQKGFSIFAVGLHGEYWALETPNDQAWILTSEIETIDNNDCITDNRPFMFIASCRVGLVTDESIAENTGIAWDPEWEDCMAYSLIHHGVSGLIASTAKSSCSRFTTSWGEKLINNFFRELIDDQGNIRYSVGQALKEAKENWGEVYYSGTDKKTMIEYLLYGVPWMKIDDPPGNLSTADFDNEGFTSDNEGFTIDISSPEQVKPEIYSRSITIDITDYSITQVEGFDLVEIPGTSLVYDDLKPVLPAVTIYFDLPAGAQNISAEVVEDTSATIGSYNVPSFVPTIEGGDYSDYTDVVGCYPISIHSTNTINLEYKTRTFLSVMPIQHNPQTNETILHSHTKLQLTYETPITATMTEFSPEKTEYISGETISTSLTVENVGSDTLTGLHANLSLKDSHGQVKASSTSAPFGMASGESTTVYPTLSQNLPHGSYLLEVNVEGSGILGSSSAYVYISSGGIVDFSVPSEVKGGDDLATVITFVNGQSASVQATGVVYVYDPHDIEIAELYSVPTTIPASSTGMMDIAWSTLGREFGDYRASAVVFVGEEAFGPVYKIFEIISPNQPPVANAGPDQTVCVISPATTAMVTFNGSGSYDPDGDALTYNWTWDGNTAYGVNATVELPLGTTTITLVVNDGKVDSDPDAVSITVNSKPKASFSALPRMGCAPLDVKFIDQSTGNPTSWEWDFDDGGTSNSRNPTHAYITPGAYYVSLTVTNDCGSDTFRDTCVIVVFGVPEAAFNASLTNGCAPLTVNFTDLSTGDPTSWSWDFGDGATSPEQHTSHTYSNPGTYNVTLTVTNDCGSDAETKTGYITAEPCAPDFSDSTENYKAVNATSAEPGDTLAFTIYYKNTGDMDATGVVITDVVDVNLENVTPQDGGSYNSTTRTITWDIGVVAVNSSGLVSFTADIVSPLDDGTIIYNIGTIGSDQTDPVYTDTTETTVTYEVVATTLELTPESATNILPGDDSHEFTVIVEDQHENRIAGQNVSLETDFGTLSVDQVTTGVNGTATFNISSTTPGTALITATLGSLSDTSTKTWTYTPEATTLELLPGTGSNPVGTTHNLTATVRDQFGDVMEGVAVTWDITGVGEFSSTPESPTDVNGQADAVITSSIPGTSTVRCEVTDNTSIFDTATKNWTYEPVATTLELTPPSATNILPGDDSHEFTVIVEDQYDGPMAGQNVSLETTFGTLSVDQVTTGVNGTATFTISSNETGMATIRATLGDLIATATKNWTLEVPVTTIALTPPSATNILPDETSHKFTVTVKEDGNPMAGQNVSLETDFGTLSDDQVTTGGNGTATFTISSTTPGTAIITATLGDLIATATKEWILEVPVPTTLELLPESATNILPGDDSHEFTVTVKDQHGEPMAGQNVSLETDFGTLSVDDQVTTGVNGTATFTISSNETGMATIRATLGDLIATATKNWTLEVPVTTIALTPPSATNILPGDTNHEFTVTVKEDGNSMAGQNVSLETTFGTLSVDQVTTGINGTVTFTISSNETGTATIRATLGDLTATAIKIWRTTAPSPTPGGGVGGGVTLRYLTVDWDENITKKLLYSNDRLTVDLLGPSPDGKHSLLLERRTLAPTVDGKRHYLIVIRELGPEEIPPLPGNKTAIIAFNVTPAGAVFDKDVFLTVGFDQLPENTLNATMNYYDDVNGVWVPVESEAGGPNGVAELTLSAPINHFSIFGVLVELAPTPPLPPSPAHFVPSDLSIVTSVEKIWETVTFVTKTGESVTITANVLNDGGQEGTYTVELKLNGETVDTEIVTLGAGQSQPVSFTLSGLDYGQYEVEVAGLNGDFTTSRTITWWLSIVIIVAIGLIIWGVVWGRRRRRKVAKEG